MFRAPKQLPRTPDGERYWDMAAGVAQPRPFNLRWLVPRGCGQSSAWWWWTMRVSFVVSCALAWVYTGAWAAALVPLGLAGMTVYLRAPVLVDLPAQTYALLAAVTMRTHGPWPTIVGAVFISLVSGTCKETAPLFAAAYAWSPWPLLGLCAPLVRAWRSKAEPAPTDDSAASRALRAPIRTALEVRRRQPFLWYVLPWGVLVVGLAHMTPQLAVVLALAYGQLLVATDLVRLYQWAWPTLALCTFEAVPRRWWLLLIVLHLASPHKGEGW